MRALAFSLAVIVVLIAGTSAQAAWRGFAVTDVNMRSGPGTGYAVIDVVPEGGGVFVDSCGGNWCDVTWQGIDGYISRRYLEQTRILDDAPPREIYPPVYEDDYEDDYFDEPEYREVIVIDPPRVRTHRRFRQHRAHRRAARRAERRDRIVRERPARPRGERARSRDGRGQPRARNMPADRRVGNPDRYSAVRAAPEIVRRPGCS